MDGNLKSAFPIDLNDAVRLVVRRNLDRLETAAKAVQESDPESQPSDNEMPNLTQIFSTDSNKASPFSHPPPIASFPGPDHVQLWKSGKRVYRPELVHLPPPPPRLNGPPPLSVPS